MFHYLEEYVKHFGETETYLTDGGIDECISDTGEVLWIAFPNNDDDSSDDTSDGNDNQDDNSVIVQNISKSMYLLNYFKVGTCLVTHVLNQ